jgi:DNA-binding NarL/FixJ family response regulator
MRVLVADDQVRVRSALRLLLEDEAGLVIVGEVADGIGLFRQVQSLRPDVILLDWELPRLDRDRLHHLLFLLRPRPRLIAMSGHPESHAQALALGADAFINKGHPPEELLATLRSFSLPAPNDTSGTEE